MTENYDVFIQFIKVPLGCNAVELLGMNTGMACLTFFSVTLTGSTIDDLYGVWNVDLGTNVGV